MAVERTSTGSSLVEVLDRVLDKGIVIDAWVRLSLVGIDLVTVEARVVVASIATYLQFTETVGASAVLASAVSAARLSPSFPKTLREGKESYTRTWSAGYDAHLAGSCLAAAPCASRNRVSDKASTEAADRSAPR